MGAETELAVFAVGEGAAVEKEFGVLGLACAVEFVAQFAPNAGGEAVVDVVALDSAENAVSAVLKFDAVEASFAVFAVLVVVAGALFVSCAVFEKFWGAAGEVVEVGEVFFYEFGGELDFCDAL